jgi:hypothetical protein
MGRPKGFPFFILEKQVKKGKVLSKYSKELIPN